MPDLSKRARPNLFIVGAAKSGTTAIASFLGEHPEIFMAPWELNYFGRDLEFRKADGSRWRMSLEQYLGVFAFHHSERYRGDHSVFSLYSETAAH
ncbi:MAG: sulfotransferase, partial [Nitrososphaerales archaeon]